MEQSGAIISTPAVIEYSSIATRINRITLGVNTAKIPHHANRVLKKTNGF